MNDKVFLSTNGQRLARAECNGKGQWSVETLLDGQKVCCLVKDPHHPNVVYAGTQGSGVLRSDDRGKTWRAAGMDGHVIKSLAISPLEPDVIYAGTKPPMLFVSHDAGNRWTELESFRKTRRWFWNTPAEPGDPYVQGLALSPTDPNTIIAGIEYGAMLLSRDGGLTWSKHLKGASRDCHSLTFHVTDGNWVYQGGGGWPAAVSQDGGVTWTPRRKGMRFSLYGWAVAADPERPEIWYVSAAPLAIFPKLYLFPRMHWDGHSNSSIFRFTEEGRWKRLGGGLPQPLDYAAYALITDPAAPGHLYAGLSNGDVWHSADYGDSWRQLALNMGSIWTAMIMI